MRRTRAMNRREKIENLENRDLVAFLLGRLIINMLGLGLLIGMFLGALMGVGIVKNWVLSTTFRFVMFMIIGGIVTLFMTIVEINKN